MKHHIFLISVVVVMNVWSVAQAQDDANASMNDIQGSMPGMSHDVTPDSNDMNTQDMEMPFSKGSAVPPDASATPALRDPQAYADGYDFGPIPRPHFADERNFASLLVDRLERVRTTDNNVTSYDLQAWYGRDYNRAVLKTEGDIDGGTLQDAHTELLWGHAVAAFWDTQLGVRYDSGAGPDRSWLAVGFQGLAPYWFEVDATAYVRDAGQSALRISADYELLFTQKLILQPRLDANFYGKEDAARNLGAGLSDLSIGMRLRYEIRRESAPYVGIEWVGQYGGTAEYARAAGDPTKETHYVAGLLFWF
jgi:copper resistance protein B